MDEQVTEHTRQLGNGQQATGQTKFKQMDEQKQAQLDQAAHQEQLDTNLQLTGHPVDLGQAMVSRKIKDKKSRKPLTGAEKVDIIYHVRGENGQGKSYRQISKDSGYPISTISRVVKEWREKTAASTASVNCKHLDKQLLAQQQQQIQFRKQQHIIILQSPQSPQSSQLQTLPQQLGLSNDDHQLIQLGFGEAPSIAVGVPGRMGSDLAPRTTPGRRSTANP
ncbi:hypothetical protein BGX34_000297 [Mortierella sp. NVP85]|nr:hypothetical protein BGX34_000297 [Mortierella sp. NVP85]